MIKKFMILLAATLILFATPIYAENVTIDNATHIQDAINVVSDNDVIYLNPGTYHESGIKITKDITLQGLGNARDIIIDGDQKDSIILINKKSTVTLKNITFINGKSNTYGGAVYTEIAKSVHISNCIFENNTALKDGGALEISSKFNPNPREFFYGYLEVDNCSFINNYALYSGGAIGTYYVDADIKNSEFKNNYAGDFAGVLSFVNGIFSVSSSNFENNYADYDGGVIRQNQESVLTIKDSRFINNTAKEWGGALYNWLGNLTVENCTISNNTAGIRGGGIFTAGPLTATSSQFTNNTAEQGGMLYVFQEFYVIEPIVTFNNNTVSGNTAVEGSLTYYFLLTYTRSDYENNYWGDINPNSTNWDEEFLTNEYTTSPTTWIEKAPLSIADDPKTENESKTDNRTRPPQDGVDQKNESALNSNQKTEKTIMYSIIGNWAANNTYTTDDNPDETQSDVSEIITKQIDSNNNLNLVLIILILIIAYGIYRFEK